MTDTQAATNTTRMLGDLLIVKTCRRCGSVDWDPATDACRKCGLTGWSNSSRRKYKRTIHHRRSTWNRRKATHGRQLKRSLRT